MANNRVSILIQAKDAAGKVLRGVESRLHGIRRIAGGAAGALGTLGLAIGAHQVVSFLTSTNRQFESLTAQLKVLEGSSEGARRVFNWIEQFAAKTPFQIEDLTQAYVRLRTAGIQPTEEMLTSFGDLSSARGKSIIDFAMAVEDAVTGEMERLKEFGVKAKQSGDTVAFTFNGTTKVVSNTKDAITAYLEEVGRSAVVQGSMAGQMTTLNGVISNTLDTLGTLARTIGEEGFTGEAKNGIGAIGEFSAKLIENRGVIGYWTRAIIAATKFIGQIVITTVRVLFNATTTVGRAIQLVFLHMKANGQETFNAMSRDVNRFIAGLNHIPGVEIDFRMSTADVAATRAEIRDVTDAIKGDARDVGDAFVDAWVSFEGMQEAFHAGKESIIKDAGAALPTGPAAGSGGGDGKLTKEQKAALEKQWKAAEKEIDQWQKERHQRGLNGAPSTFIYGGKGAGSSFDNDAREANRANLLGPGLIEPIEGLKAVALGIFSDLGAAAAETGGVIADSFSDAFELMFTDLDNLGAGFDALWRGMGAGILGALSQVAKTKAAENLAYVVEATAKGLGMLATGHPGAGAMFASAGKHVAAAAAWSALAGGGAAAAGGIGGRGGGGGGASHARKSADRLGGSGKGEAVVVLEGGFAALMQDPDAQDSFARMMENLSDRRVVVRRG